MPDLETGGYFIIWIGAILYSVFKVKKASEELFVQDNYGDFSDGWQLLGGEGKDTSDYEWETIVYLFRQQFSWLCLHLIISELLRWKNYNNLLPWAQIVVTLTYLIFSYNISVLLIVLLQPVLFEIFSKFKKKYIVWLGEIFCLILLHGYRHCSYHGCIPYFNVYVSYNEHTVVLLTVYWINLRCISYYTNKLNNIKTYGVTKMLSYCLYLPLLSTGPFVDFNEFIKCEDSVKTTFSLRMTKCAINLIRFIFWMIITDFLLHYVYASGISFYPTFVEKFDNWTLYGYGYCMGQYFHMKYVVLYGISTTLAKFENITAPSTPKCIARIHLYSDMWRYFDKGLYTFLARYIYVPLIKMKVLPFLASFISFSFVYVWHGLTVDILIWAFLNYICLTIESSFKHLYKTYIKKECEDIFDEIWRQRLSCTLASPLLAVSAISNFYFFAGIEIGNIFFKRFFSGGIQMLCLLLFCLYCCCQVSTYMKKREKIKEFAGKSA